MNRFHSNLSEVFSRLWKLDANACEPNKDYVLNLQKKARGQRDLSSEKLFTKFSEHVLSRPTYAAFCKLLDNYEADTNSPEVETKEEKQEENEFLTAIMQTKVMKEAHAYLKKEGKSSADEQAFREQLYDIWFRSYRRKVCDKEINSSGFEHVFVGEIQGGEVIGFHNWINIYLQEKHGALDYHGYYDDEKLQTNGQSLELLTFQFSWRGVIKPRSSSFFGTSPELEIAVYTIAFLCKKPELFVMINGYPVELKIYCHGKGIGTAYPKCLIH